MNRLMYFTAEEKELLKEVFKLAREGVTSKFNYAVSMYNAELEESALRLEKEVQDLQTKIFPKG
ncbi:MAG: hypothetical protein ACRDC4_00830 [Plesiomonas sp.]